MTLHKPQKDSPSTYLTTAIDSDDTTLVVADSLIFSAANITRLTLGYDTATTETVTVVSYESNNRTIVVERGAPSYSWAAGTKIARVLTAQDITEIHDFLYEHNHDASSSSALASNSVGKFQIIANSVSTSHIMDSAVTEEKLAWNIGYFWPYAPTVYYNGGSEPGIYSIAGQYFKIKKAVFCSIHYNIAMPIPGQSLPSSYAFTLPLTPNPSFDFISGFTLNCNVNCGVLENKMGVYGVPTLGVTPVTLEDKAAIRDIYISGFYAIT